MVRATAVGAIDEVNRLEVHYWLDGPAQPEGRVYGKPRELMFQRNGQALAASSPGGDADRPESWSRLGEVHVPTLLLVGDYDETGLMPLTELMAAHISAAQIQRLNGSAHCPMLDQPRQFASTVLGFLAAAGIGR